MTPIYNCYVESTTSGSGANIAIRFDITDIANGFSITRQVVSAIYGTYPTDIAIIAYVQSQIDAYCIANSITLNATYWFVQTGAMIAATIAAKVPYTAYQGIVSQTGTSAPANTDLMNGFAGTTFAWARTAVGVYTVTASSAVFTSGKTSVILGALNNLNANMKIAVTSSTVITITTAVQSVAILGLLGLTATNTDALLTAAPFDIRVYP